MGVSTGPSLPSRNDLRPHGNLFVETAYHVTICVPFGVFARRWKQEVDFLHAAVGSVAGKYADGEKRGTTDSLRFDRRGRTGCFFRPPGKGSCDRSRDQSGKETAGCPRRRFHKLPSLGNVAEDGRYFKWKRSGVDLRRRSSPEFQELFLREEDFPRERSNGSRFFLLGAGWKRIRRKKVETFPITVCLCVNYQRLHRCMNSLCQ